MTQKGTNFKIYMEISIILFSFLWKSVPFFALRKKNHELKFFYVKPLTQTWRKHTYFEIAFSFLSCGFFMVFTQPLQKREIFSHFCNISILFPLFHGFFCKFPLHKAEILC